MVGFHDTGKPARQAVLKALDLDPNLAAAHCQLGDLYMAYDWDWSGRCAGPWNWIQTASGHGMRSEICSRLGRFPEALEQKRRAVAVDPLSAMAQSS